MTASRCRMTGLATVVFVLASVPAPGRLFSVMASAASPPQASAVATADATDWFRISQMNGVASGPAMAYNPTLNEYLVVWAAGDIYGQRIDAATGAEVGPNDFRISEMLRGAANPSVSYNPSRNEYLVVWDGDNYPNWTSRQVYSQLLTAEGAEIGFDSLVAGGPTVPFTGYCGTRFPVTCYPSQWGFRAGAATYNATAGEYLVTYRTLYPYPVDYGIIETIVAGRLSESGAYVGGSGLFQQVAAACCRLGSPAVAHNSATNEYLVVWSEGIGNNYSTLTNLFAVRVDASAASVGSRFQLSGMAYSADSQVVAYNSGANEFLIVWRGVHETLPADVPQIFGQRLSAEGAQVGTDDFRISNAATSYSGEAPNLAYDPVADEYLVVWNATTLPSGGGVVGQRLSATGAEIGANDFLLTGNMPLNGSRPALALDTARHQYLIATSANASPLSTGVFEIFGRSYAVPEPFVVGPGQGGEGQFHAWATTSDGVVRQKSLTLPWPWYNSQNGESHPAVGDVDGDGLDEIVLGLGAGGQGWIAVFDDAAHGYALLRWIQLPWPSYNAANGTIWPAVGDVDGDGRAEIVAGLGQGGQGYFAVFDDAASNFSFTTWRRVGWSDYSQTRSGETHPAIANIDDGANSEIVIGLGPGGQGWLELFDDAAAGFAYLGWLRVGWTDYTLGAGETYPAGGDIDGDGYDEIVVGLGPQSEGWAEIFDDAFAGLAHKAWLQVGWPDYARMVGETHPAVGDVDGDPEAEILLGLGAYPGQGGYFEIRDDSTHGYASLGWGNVGLTHVSVAGGATFPAVGRGR